MGGAVGAPAEAGSRLPPAPRRGLPDSPGNLLRFIQEVHAHYLHQRPLHTPVVVHCRYGPHGGGGAADGGPALGPAYTRFPPQLWGGPHGSLRAALRRRAGGRGWERDPRAASAGAAHATAEEAHAAGESEARLVGAGRWVWEGPSTAGQQGPARLTKPRALSSCTSGSATRWW